MGSSRGTPLCVRAVAAWAFILLPALVSLASAPRAAADDATARPAPRTFTPRQLEHLRSVQQHIKSRFRFAPSDKGLRNVVQIERTQDGAITAAKIVQTSGSKDFDDRVLRTVLHAGPLPPTPPGMEAAFSTLRFTFDGSE